jgi:hypothetical protein
LPQKLILILENCISSFYMFCPSFMRSVGTFGGAHRWWHLPLVEVLGLAQRLSVKAVCHPETAIAHRACITSYCTRRVKVRVLHCNGTTQSLYPTCVVNFVLKKFNIQFGCAHVTLLCHRNHTFRFSSMLKTL